MNKQTNDELEKHRKLSDWYYIKSNRKSKEQQQEKDKHQTIVKDDLSTFETSTSFLLMTTVDGKKKLHNDAVSENHQETKSENNSVTTTKMYSNNINKYSVASDNHMEILDIFAANTKNIIMVPSGFNLKNDKDEGFGKTILKKKNDHKINNMTENIVDSFQLNENVESSRTSLNVNKQINYSNICDNSDVNVSDIIKYENDLSHISDSMKDNKLENKIENVVNSCTVNNSNSESVFNNEKCVLSDNQYKLPTTFMQEKVNFLLI